MRSRFQRVVGLGMLVLAAGCATGSGTVDLPQPRAIPTFNPSDSHDYRVPDDVMIPLSHPPDAIITAREPAAHWERWIEARAARFSPITSWSLFSLALIVF
jgi:hypothetical protein